MNASLAGGRLVLGPSWSASRPRHLPPRLPAPRNNALLPLDWLSHIQMFPSQPGADTTEEAGLPSPRGQLGNKALGNLENPVGLMG